MQSKIWKVCKTTVFDDVLYALASIIGWLRFITRVIFGI